MDHPNPRAFPGRFASFRIRPSGNPAGFVPIHSGGSVPESHRLPFSGSKEPPDTLEMLHDALPFLSHGSGSPVNKKTAVALS